VDLALVGPALSGKTTLFRAITHGHAAGGADARGEHIGAIKIEDERLDCLAAFSGAKKTTPIEVRLHDMPPLFERGAAPAGEAAETLNRADALLIVVRAFERDDVPHPQGSVDPRRDIESFQAELALHDQGIIERRLEKLDITVRSARPGERDAGEREVALLERMRGLLEGGKPLRTEVTDPADLKALAGYGLLTLKPALIVLNIGEADLPRSREIEAEYQEAYGGPGARCAAICARLEAELAELSDEEASEFRRDMGAAEGATERLLALATDLLRLITFFTMNEREARAWTLPKGSSALQAAGRIHTDMERGFIRAEAIPWKTLLDLGSFAEARKHGQLRTEGKQYEVQDGDVLHILFNV
jgi:ribosome-binding ATPase